MIRPFQKSRSGLTICLLFFSLLYIQCNGQSTATPEHQDTLQSAKVDSLPKKDSIAQTDTALYNQKILQMVHNKPSDKWPVKAPYPLPGAILPFKRVIAYYGNLYSKGMGILGELPEDKMIEKLKGEVKKWEEADSTTPVVPALHYIAVTAQGSPGAAKKYRLRMPFTQIDKVLEMSKKIENSIVFLDIQIGHSTLQQEIPELKKYLMMPNVHLGIDPEFSMKTGKVPSASIGTMDAEDINYASEYLAQLVRENNLPPKILVVHRFTKGMVTNYKKIEMRPEVQVVIHMDGFGFPAKKITTYKQTILSEPIQFTGFKLFYKNDVADKKYPNLMTPKELIALYPQPLYIQYQ